MMLYVLGQPCGLSPSGNRFQPKADVVRNAGVFITLYPALPPIASRPTICMAMTFTRVIDGKIIA
jgi:hypothetical protein